MRLLRKGFCVTLAVMLAMASGCYRFTPIEGSAPEPGRDVRLSLTDEGSVRLAPLIGPRIGAIDGRILASTDTALVVGVQAVVGQGGRSMGWNMERLSVPRSAVASIHTRTLDRRKTWIVAGLGVVGALAIGESFGLGNGFGGFLGIGGNGGKK